jgi:N-methylhydantoinase A/oxoprolinase/acetone carboxylase beta subunit
MTYSLAVDIGGTFTDVVLRHSSGVLTVDKVLTTHQDLLQGFFSGSCRCATILQIRRLAFILSLRRRNIGSSCGAV